MEDGVDVWIRDEAAAWVRGTLLSQSTTGSDVTATVQIHGSGTVREIKSRVEEDGSGAADIKLCNTDLADDDESGATMAAAASSGGSATFGVDDLINLTHLHEPAILHALCLRYSADEIYTYTGPILLAVNPFQRLEGLYSRERLEQYYSHGLLKSQGVEDQDALPPHVFATADAAYRSMMDGYNQTPADGKFATATNQSVLVSGESGAGKTETAKVIMRYLSIVGREMGSNMAGQGHVYHAHGGAPPAKARPAPAVGAGSASETPRTPSAVARTRAALGAEAAASTPRSDGKGAFSSRDMPSAAAAAAAEEASVEMKVLQSNPILETFGNARTVRNENSSRFGKFIELQFDLDGQLVGARIQTYLLEKVRIVSQASSERNYHSFYQVCAGLSTAQAKDWGITRPEDFHYTNQSGLFTLSGVSDAEEHATTLRAMEVMGFSQEARDGIWQTLAALLHLGATEFEGDETATVTAASANHSKLAARLLGVEHAALLKVLTSQRIEVGGEVTFKLFGPAKATDSRDALAKQVYGKMFDWIVARVNDSIRHDDETASFIGVLDIFGFESFKENSFEQLCINYTNEQLQQHFNHFVFKLEQEEYTREGIDWADIPFPDNQDVLDLIEARKPPGLLSLLDEACLMPRGDDKSFANKTYDNLKASARFSASSKHKARAQFAVLHYAGEVVYTSDGFCEKNKDTIPAEASALVAASTNAVTAAYFAADPAAAAAEVESAAAAASAGGGRGRGARKSGMNTTVSTQFRTQLKSLMTVVRATAPHYIRCLKPNAQAKPRLTDRTNLVQQLRCNGVLEAVRVSRLGYPVRLLHAQFLVRYACLLPTAESRARTPAPPVSDAAARGAWMLRALDGIEEGQFQVGLTKIFFRKAAYDTIESQRTLVLREAVIKLQAAARMFVYQRRFCRMRAASVVMQCAVRSWAARAALRTLREHRAATAIQARTRAHLHRLRFAVFRGAVVRLQAALRGAAGRVVALGLRREQCATLVQAVWRGHARLGRYRRERAACLVIQCASRSAAARATLRRLRKEAREVGNLREDNVALKKRVAELEQALHATRTQHAAEVQGLRAALSDAESRAQSGATAAAPDAEAVAPKPATQPGDGAQAGAASAGMAAVETAAGGEAGGNAPDAMAASEATAALLRSARAEADSLRKQLASLRAARDSAAPAGGVDAPAAAATDLPPAWASGSATGAAAGADTDGATAAAMAPQAELEEARRSAETAQVKLVALRGDAKRKLSRLERRVFELTQQLEASSKKLQEQAPPGAAAAKLRGRARHVPSRASARAVISRARSLSYASSDGDALPPPSKGGASMAERPTRAGSFARLAATTAAASPLAEHPDDFAMDSQDSDAPEHDAVDLGAPATIAGRGAGAAIGGGGERSASMRSTSSALAAGAHLEPGAAAEEGGEGDAAAVPARGAVSRSSPPSPPVSQPGLPPAASSKLSSGASKSQAVPAAPRQSILGRIMRRMVRGTSSSAKAAITDKEIHASLAAQHIMSDHAAAATPSPSLAKAPRFLMFGGKAGASASPAAAKGPHPSSSGHAAALADITSRLEMLRAAEEEEEEEGVGTGLLAEGLGPRIGAAGAALPARRARGASDGGEGLEPTAVSVARVRERPEAAAAELLRQAATERRLRRRLATYEEALATLKRELQLAEENRHAMVDRVMQLGDDAMEREESLSRAKRQAARAAEEATAAVRTRDAALAELRAATEQAAAAEAAFKATMGAQQSHVEVLTRGLARSQEEYSKASKRGMALAQRLDRSGAQSRKQQQELRQLGLLVSELNAAILTAATVMRAADMEVPAILARRAALAVRQDGTIASPSQMATPAAARAAFGAAATSPQRFGALMEDSGAAEAPADAEAPIMAAAPTGAEAEAPAEAGVPAERGADGEEEADVADADVADADVAEEHAVAAEALREGGGDEEEGEGREGEVPPAVAVLPASISASRTTAPAKEDCELADE